MVQAWVLPVQDSYLMSQGDELELQREATTNPKREQGTEGGQKRDHADDGMTTAEGTLQLLGVLDFWACTGMAWMRRSASFVVLYAVLSILSEPCLHLLI